MPDSVLARPALGRRELLIIMAAAFAMVIPFFFLGNASGHDFEFHMNSWMEVLAQWKHGIAYPRWAALAHFGFGEPRFIFYPPASWMMGAALGALLPWKIVPGAYVWLTLTFSGCSMFVLARSWMNPRDAIFASVLYAVNPYYILLVYWRSAFAELLAGALLPLLLLYVLRSEDEEREITLPLSLIAAAAWLTNLPAAVMLNYSLALLALVTALVRRSPRIVLQAAGAVVLGAGLAAFFVVPAAYEQRWVNIDQVLSPGVRPEDNFLVTFTNDPDHNRFNLMISFVAAAEMSLLAFALWFARRRRRGSRLLWWTLSSWTIALMLVMSSVTLLLWQHFPWLRFVQIPWRWLLCLSLIFALAVTAGWERWRTRLAACALMLLVIGFVAHFIQPAWWDGADSIAALVNGHHSAAGYEGTDEYTPKGADGYNISQSAPLVAYEGSGSARIQVRQWETESKLFTAELSQPGKLGLRLFKYPAWRVEVNGQAISTQSQEDTGQMLIPVQTGENRVRIRFARTWDRTAGALISVVSAGLLFAIGGRRRRTLSRRPVAER